MAPHRSPTAELAKLLGTARQPIYVLDEDFTIVFLNRACLEWLGLDAQELLGQRCVYHSTASTEQLDAVVAGLCPPPQAMSGEAAMATVAKIADAKIADNRRPIERMARFVPLGLGENDTIGILAIVDTDDLPPDAAIPTTAEPEPIALHEHIRRFRHEAAARCRADRLIGQGAAMRLARRQVELAAACRSSVLLVGPSGSGRQRLAAAIHYGENAAEKNADAYSSASEFILLDCSLLTGDLLEAAGAALARAAGQGEASPFATLLFHRVDELPADVQTQLADFLTRRSLHCRLMATAVAPLVESARHGKFHPELAALFSTMVIDLPPLVNRREDLPLLSQLFLEEQNAAGTKQIGGFSPAALDLLDAFPWPENLDELAAVVAEAHRSAGGPRIEAADLPERIRLAAQAVAQPRKVDETIVLDEFLGHVERELIRRALSRAKGNKARAARLLGVTRPRLYRRMVQLGLE